MDFIPVLCEDRVALGNEEVEMDAPEPEAVRALGKSETVNVPGVQALMSFWKNVNVGSAVIVALIDSKIVAGGCTMVGVPCVPFPSIVIHCKMITELVYLF